MAKDLLQKALAVRRLDRWNSFETVQATIVTGGATIRATMRMRVVFLPALDGGRVSRHAELLEQRN